MTGVRAAVRLGLVAAAVAGVVVVGFAGRGTTRHGTPVPTAAAGTGSADDGPLHIRGAYIPAQTATDEAAAYFTVTDTGATADTLTRVTSDAAPAVTLHATVTAHGADRMVPLSVLAVPARGTAAFSVGHDHLMLEHPAHQLEQGERVMLTLTFARNGVVRLTVPVVPVTGPSGGGPAGR